MPTPPRPSTPEDDPSGSPRLGGNLEDPAERDAAFAAARQVVEHMDGDMKTTMTFLVNRADAAQQTQTRLEESIAQMMEMMRGVMAPPLRPTFPLLPHDRGMCSLRGSLPQVKTCLQRQ